MKRRITNKDVVRRLRVQSKRLKVLADDFERNPRKMRKRIESITISIKFKEEYFFPKISKI